MRKSLCTGPLPSDQLSPTTTPNHPVCCPETTFCVALRPQIRRLRVGRHLEDRARRGALSDRWLSVRARSLIQPWRAFPMSLVPMFYLVTACGSTVPTPPTAPSPEPPAISALTIHGLLTSPRVGQSVQLTASVTPRMVTIQPLSRWLPCLGTNIPLFAAAPLMR